MFRFQINLENMNLIEFDIERTSNFHPLAFKAVNQIGTVQAVNVFSRRQH